MGHKVSIVILADKTEHLSECMESVLKQNHQDIEVICVTDSSNKDIFDRVHQHQDKRVRYLDLNEGELAEGYNKALEQATGEFVLLLNSDSILKPEMVEKMLAAADKSDIIISGYTEVQDNGNTNNVRYSNDFKKSPLTVQKQKNIYDLMFPGPWNKLIRLDLVKKNKLTLERTEGFYTFVQFLFLCFCYAKDIKVIDDALLRSPNHVFRESFSDEKTYINLIKQIDSVFQQIKKRNLGSCWDAFTATGRQLLRKIIVSHPVWRLRQLLPLIQKNMSPDAFDRIFYQDRSFYACKAVAIIIPAYNAEATLARCLDSACQQTLKDIEIICIDDGSTDDTLNILNEYARKDNRITVLHQENSGQAIARNKGLRVAAGEYIQFLDADDYLDPDACEILYLYSRLADLDMCLLMSTLRNGNGDKIESWAAPGANLPNLLKVVKFVTFNKNSLGTRIAELCHAPWATFYKRRFLLNYNISFINKRITYCEDLPFFIICVLKANNIGMFTSPVYNYVRGGRNTMTAAFLSERLTYDPTYCFQYTLNIVHGLGEHELFNLFFNSFTRSVISDLNRQTPENKVIMREYAYRFFRQLMRQYRLELPPLCYQWGLDYLKGQPLKKILFRLKNWYLRFRGRFLTQIVSCQIKEPFKVKFLGIPIGHLTEQRVGREKVKTFLMGRLPILTIREEV